MRQKYGSEELDRIFCYFMKTALRCQRSGIEELPVEADFAEPIKSYLELSVELLIDGTPPELSDVILQSEYDFLLHTFGLDRQQMLELLLIKRISEHIHYDNNCFEYLLSTSNLWQNEANEYACRTFYMNLPAEIKQKEGVEWMLSHIPEGMLEPDNF